MLNTMPTKGNLMAAKRSLALAEQGYDLMDRKRSILIREMMSLMDQTGDLQSRIAGTFEKAYAALREANITLGIVNELAQSVTPDDSVTIRIRSVMGVELPIVGGADKTPELEYGMVFSDSVLDQATAQFHNVKLLSRQLAETETAVYRLAYAIKKTQKRANALHNIIIPNLKNTVIFIAQALEEKEREEFVRLKVLKRKQQANTARREGA